MNIYAAVALAGAAVLSSGCAIKPIPDDVTPDTTFHIAKRIRCEARESIVRKTRLELLASGAAEDRRVGALLTSGDAVPSLVEAFDRDPTIVHEKTAERIRLLKNTVIAFKFRLVGTETNNNVVNISFGERVTRGLVSLKIQGGNDRKRENSRVFTIADDFSSIFRRLDDKECREIEVASPHWMYPITGRIGVYETVSTFVDIALDAQYQNEKDATFIDTITFTTKNYGNVEPKITLEAADQFDLTEASTKPDLSRQDVHEVTISFVIKPDTGKAPKADSPKQAAATEDAKTTAVKNINREENLQLFRDIREELRE